MTMKTKKCCKIGCNSDAEYNIQETYGGFEDYTLACERHVGALLGTSDVKGLRVWTITDANADEEAPDGN
jgi:hypothetical protein